MESVSTRLSDETYRYVRETADERGVSVAEILRELVEKGRAYDDLERENDRLRSEKRTIIQQREEHTELVEYVEEERTIRQRREERERERRQANALRRAWWWLAGEPGDDADA
jgi:septal ring factor EnvC (AmiA/AmiB activator)